MRRQPKIALAQGSEVESAEPLQRGSLNFKIMLGALLLLLMIAPFVQGARFAEEVMTGGLGAVVYLTIHSMSQGKVTWRLRWLGGITAGGAILAYLTPYQAFDDVSVALYVVFLVYACLLIGRSIMASAQVTLNVILAAVYIYLLLGVTWGLAYALLDSLHPHSFTIPAAGNTNILDRTLQHFIYYSFEALTTLGYGDIVPLTTPARYASVLEAVAGQMYLTILVARLVGMHISQKSPAFHIAKN